MELETGGTVPLQDDSDLGASPALSDPRIDSLLELYGRRLDSEHNLLSSRMSWLLTLDSFLVAIIGVGFANLDKLGDRDLTFWLMLGVSVVGLLTNTSSLFSNYWAGRAIDEASVCVSTELEALTLQQGSSGSDASLRQLSVEGERWVGRLRLYGRDPRSELQRAGFWRPPSGVLHPWYFVPLVFMLAFAAVPFTLWRMWDLGDWARTAALFGATLAPGLLVVGALADYLYNLGRSGLWIWEDLLLGWHRRDAANARARQRRLRARKKNRDELAELERAHRLRKVVRRTPRPDAADGFDALAVTDHTEPAPISAGD